MVRLSHIITVIIVFTFIHSSLAALNTKDEGKNITEGSGSNNETTHKKPDVQPMPNERKAPRKISDPIKRIQKYKVGSLENAVLVLTDFYSYQD